MAFVLDASVAAVWYFPDEDADLANAAARRLIVETAIVPTLFWFEVRNFLVLGERRGRTVTADTTRFLARLDAMSLEVDHTPSSETVLMLARVHKLSVYDAAYLELAQRRAAPLATLDRRLKAAAQAAGIALLAG